MNYLGMVTGLALALVNVLNSGFEGLMRWVMVSCGLLLFICHVKITLDKKKARQMNQNEKKT